ncbi:hypothetical protein DCO17_01665 [Polynucleobacter tropicus]|uniref:Uncharacterized protein n=2 Tax=Polynucleobacter tropicus TaxID=1743174 RepID=A0A6M9PXF7_9BURK|nr:hypothetical protein DCO17_01665 [Polynucleobacter tropicus]
MLITYVIPVLDQERTILRAVFSALAIAEELDGAILVCVNKCSDSTLDLVSGLRNDRITILSSDVLLSMRENALRGLLEVKTPYACFLSGDDWLPFDGQIQLAAVAQEALINNLSPVFFGDYHIVLNQNDDSKNVICSLEETWSSTPRRRQRENIIKIHLPNLNGAWVPIDLFIAGMKAIPLYMPEELTSYAGDVPFWWFLVDSAVVQYVPVNQVNYNGELDGIEVGGYQKRARHMQLQGIFSFYSNLLDDKSMEEYFSMISREKINALTFSKNISKNELKKIAKKFSHQKDPWINYVIYGAIENYYLMFLFYQFFTRVYRKLKIWKK